MNVLLHLFIPHHTNNHRSKVLHVDALFVYALVLVACNVFVRFTQHRYPDVLGYATDIHVEQLLAETNAKRSADGESPLVLNAALSQAAAKKAEDMFANGYWAHNSPAGKTPWDFISSLGYTYTVAGENLAKNFTDSTGVVNAWMASPSHKENLLKPSYKDVGYAVVNGTLNGEETTLVVQMFGATGVSPIADATKKKEESPIFTKSAVNKVEVPEAVPSQVSITAPTNAGGKPLALNVFSAFTGVTKRPVFNIAHITRTVTLLFVGMLLGVLALDHIVAKKKRVVRAVGHNGAHMLFFSMLLLLLTISLPGSIL